MQISLRTMLCWVLPPTAALWCAGAWPAWNWAGRSGLVAHTAAACIVLAVMFASAAMVKFFAGIGPNKAAFAFMAASFVRIALCVGITIAVRVILGLPTGVLCISTPALYMTALLAEGIWLSRALNHDASLVAMGEIRSPKRLLPSDLQNPASSAPATEQRVDTRSQQT